MCSDADFEKYKSKYFCSDRTIEKDKEYINLSYMLKNDSKHCICNLKNMSSTYTPLVDISKYTIEYIPQLLDFIASSHLISENNKLNYGQAYFAYHFLEKLYTKIDTIYFINEPYRVYILISHDNKVTVFRDEFDSTTKNWCIPKIYEFPNRKFVYKMSVNMDVVNSILNDIIIKKDLTQPSDIHQTFDSIFNTVDKNLETLNLFTSEKFDAYHTFIIKKILKSLPSSSVIYGHKMPVPIFHSLSES